MSVALGPDVNEIELAYLTSSPLSENMYLPGGEALSSIQEQVADAICPGIPCLGDCYISQLSLEFTKINI